MCRSCIFSPPCRLHGGNGTPLLCLTTSSDRRSYSNTVHCCVVRQLSTLIGSTVRDVPHSDTALLRNIPYHYVPVCYTGIYRPIQSTVSISKKKRSSRCNYQYFVTNSALKRSFSIQGKESTCFQASNWEEKTKIMKRGP
jgi:hypothetical protein